MFWIGIVVLLIATITTIISCKTPRNMDWIFFSLVAAPIVAYALGI